MEFDNNDEIKLNFINIFVPVISLATVVICIVVLVIAVNLNRKVDELSDSLADVMETVDALKYEDMATSAMDNVVTDIEVSDVEQAAIGENTAKWDRSNDKSDGMRRIYLTFDDGPSSNTDAILDVLEEYGVKATFFVVGKQNYEQQYKRIVSDGHTLAMHSYSHKYSEIYESLDSYKSDLTKLHDFLYEITGVDCNIVRFPGGSSNTVSKVDMNELIAYLNEENMTYFDWNVSAGDATGGHENAQQIAANVLDNIEKYNNVVVLFHDAAGKDTTVDALPIIINKILESENAVFLPISEDTVLVQHVHN
jgi:peptidoglycan/xylan/chitin deacetylase (PgdA/CDA1 family)